ncbi:MAG: ABC transporter substrate binding protein [Dethiobacteraceae bacterium]|jgi:putative ABC transport system substrate-binding protein|nr:ABC transporter substrate-binding protein [Bacillota bacterium]
MKGFKRKKFFSLLLTVFLLVAVISAGCAGDAGEESKDLPKIGIIQIVEHPSLNTIREEMLAELEASGYKDGENVIIDYQSAQGDATNLKTISQKFVADGYDLIIAIATPSAQAVVGETKDIPIIFSACTDPVGSGLVASMEKPGGNVTGTSDAVSAEKIMGLALEITPNIKTVGALYNAGEANSVSVINDLKAFAAANGLTVVEATVTNSSEVQQAAASLADKADAVFIPIDNTVASAMPIVAQVAKEAKLPVYVGADSMVADGGFATYGINYKILGRKTAHLAAQVLEGANPGDLPVVTIEEVEIYINQETAEAIGIDIPQAILEQANIF